MNREEFGRFGDGRVAVHCYILKHGSADQSYVLYESAYYYYTCSYGVLESVLASLLYEVNILVRV